MLVQPCRCFLHNGFRRILDATDGLTIIEQMARSQGITEALKAADQMTWVGKMNNIQASAMEIVNSELIYA